MGEPLDWRRELEAIAPLTAEERLQDRMARTRERIALFNAATIRKEADPWQDFSLDPDVQRLGRLARPHYEPPVRPPPRLSWWRRLALVLLGGEA